MLTIFIRLRTTTVSDVNCSDGLTLEVNTYKSTTLPVVLYDSEI